MIKKQHNFYPLDMEPTLKSIIRKDRRHLLVGALAYNATNNEEY